jgi:predicted Zn-dependent protease
MDLLSKLDDAATTGNVLYSEAATEIRKLLAELEKAKPNLEALRVLHNEINLANKRAESAMSKLLAVTQINIELVTRLDQAETILEELKAEGGCAYCKDYRKALENAHRDLTKVLPEIFDNVNEELELIRLRIAQVLRD